MMGSYGHVSLAINTFLRAFNWRKIGLLYHNHAEESGRGYSDCHNSLSSIFRAVNSSAYHRSFDELSSSGQSYKDMLRRIQVQARSKKQINAQNDAFLFQNCTAEVYGRRISIVLPIGERINKVQNNSCVEWRAVCFFIGQFKINNYRLFIFRKRIFAANQLSVANFGIRLYFWHSWAAFLLGLWGFLMAHRDFNLICTPRSPIRPNGDDRLTIDDVVCEDTLFALL